MINKLMLILWFQNALFAVEEEKKYSHILLDVAFLLLIDLVQFCQNRPLNFYYAFGRDGFSINLFDYVDVLQCL